jgi:hypothetical protein
MKVDYTHVSKVLSDADRMTHDYLDGKMTQLSSNTNRLLNSEAKAKWWDTIYHDVSTGIIPAEKGIDSVSHAWETGYITSIDKVEYTHILYHFVKSHIHIQRGYTLLMPNISNIAAIRQMLSFMISVEPILHKEQHDKFQSLLDDPPDDLTLPLLRWQIQCCIDGYANSKGYELGWKDGKLIFGKGGDFDAD